MLKDEFYADPTVFDHWQSNAGIWFGARYETFRPYFWSVGFSLFAMTFAMVALGVLVYPAQADTGAAVDASWNRTLAQLVTFTLALAATGRLLKLAASAWPAHADMPVVLHIAARYLRANGAAGAAGSVTGSRKRSAPTTVRAAAADDSASLPVNAALIREFFVGARSAGVNVAIARSLFDAGVRTAEHLRRASNEDLLAIHGVGMATVHKLRTRFGSV